MYKKVLVGLLSCLLLLTGLSSCGVQKSEVERKVDGVLISVPYAFSENPNPFYATEQGDLALLSLLTETYFGKSAVADFKKEQTEDGLYSVTVTIKDGQRFSNVRNVGAVDLIQAVYLVCDPRYDGPYAALGKSSLVGLKEYRSGEKTVIEGMRKINTYSCELLFESEEDYEAIIKKMVELQVQEI